MKEIASQYELTTHILLNLKHKDITQNDKDVLVAISVHTNRDNDWVCWPSVDTIEEITRMSRSSVFRALTKLKDIGVISYTKGKKGVANKYKIDLYALNGFLEEKVCYVSANLAKPKTNSSPSAKGKLWHETEDEFDNAPF